MTVQMNKKQEAQRVNKMKQMKHMEEFKPMFAFPLFFCTHESKAWKQNLKMKCFHIDFFSDSHGMAGDDHDDHFQAESSEVQKHTQKENTTSVLRTTLNKQVGGMRSHLSPESHIE